MPLRATEARDFAVATIAEKFALVKKMLNTGSWLPEYIERVTWSKCTVSAPGVVLLVMNVDFGVVFLS